MKVLITGGTGLLGRHLQEMLIQRGHEVAVLSRAHAKESGTRTFVWNPLKAQLDPSAIAWAEAIIHLAGAGIADGRWSNKRKQLILDSRVKSGALLYQSLKDANKSLAAFVAASAIGYYGATSSNHVFVEEDEAATDFQGQVCQAWEQASWQVEKLKIRTVILRVGVVLSAAGGALPKMMLPIRFGVGSPLGSGRQTIPWIHIHDVCGVFINALEDEAMRGAYNTVSNDPVSNKSFTRSVAKVLRRPLILPRIPAFLLRAALGEMSEIVLEGSPVSAEKLIRSGYKFRYPDIRQALQHLLSKDAKELN